MNELQRSSGMPLTVSLGLVQKSVRADTVAASGAIELPRDRQGGELMIEVERFVKLCKSLYPSGGMKL